MERLKAAYFAAAVMLSLVLSGCGGGGGGSSAISDPSSASGLSVSPGTVGFAAVHNGALPPPQSLQIVISRQDAFYLEAGYPLSVTPPTWLTQNPTVSGTGATRTLTGGVTTTSMAPGTYTSTLRIMIQDFNRSVLAYRDVPVSYTITTAPLAASPTTLSFLQVIGSPAPGPQTVTIMGDLANWTAATDQSWIGVTPNSGSGAGAVSVSVDPSGLVPNNYTGTVTFSSGGKTAAVAVSLSVALPDFQAGLSSLAFSGVNGATLPSQSLTIGLNNGAPINWNAASGDNWLVLSRTSGTQSDPLGVSVNPANGPLASGTYNSTITLTGSIAGRALTKTINVSLTLTKPAFLPSSSSLSFSGINGATLPSQPLSIGINNGTTATWNAASGAPWLVLSRASGTTSDALGVSVNPAIGPLASGIYSSTITLTGSVNGDALTKTIGVALSLSKATLTVNPASVTLGGEKGRDFGAVPVQLSLNTGANAFAWTSSASSFVQPLGSGSASAAPLTVNLTPNTIGFLGGTYNGSASFSLQINGDAVSTVVPVTLNLDAHKLLVDGNGVAFASTPALSRLTRTLRVRDNFGRATAWSAAADQPWLAVTPAGTADGTASADLTLTADPTGLAADKVYLAKVTITSPDSSVENTEVVRVGLWVGSTTPGAQTPISIAFSWQLAADPIRPYVYLAGAGAAIQIYNIYTESPVTTITIPGVAAQVGAMVASHDGSTLYAIDTTNFKIVPLNLDTLEFGAPISPAAPPYYLDYTRTDGTELLFSGNGQIFNARTGAAFSPTFSGDYYGFVLVAAARNGTRLCTLNTGISPYTIACYPLDYTSANGGKVLLGASPGGGLLGFGAGSNGQDLAVNADGTRAYPASGAPYEFDVFETATMGVVQALPGDAYPNNVEVAADGRIFAGASVWYGPTDVWVYNAGGTQLATYRIAGYARALLNGQLKISGDGLRMITLTDDPSLTFTTVGP
jgi:hypothetical protein